MTAGLLGVHSASFGRSAHGAARSDLLEMWADRLAWSGIPVEPDRYTGGLHNSFTDMSRRILHTLCGSVGPDLIVIAHGTPDADARVSLAGTLGGSGALILAVSDQGRLAPFTALRLALAYPDRPRAVIVAVDQNTMTYADPDLALLDRERDHAVGLLLGPPGAILLTAPRIHTDLAPTEVPDLLTAELSETRIDLLIAGRSVPEISGIRTVRAETDQLSSAVWSTLAAELRRPAAGARRIAVVEYEPSLQIAAALILECRPDTRADSGAATRAPVLATIQPPEQLWG